MGRTEIYACGESVSRRNSSESEVLFSLKQEAPASIGGGTFTYIDVRKDHRHEGIGKRLLKEFNTLLHDNIPVWCSFFSDYCIETKFNEIIEKSLCNYDVVYDHKYVIKAGTAEHVYFY